MSIPKTSLHLYRESGLDNIFIKVTKFKDDENKNCIEIPAMRKLHSLIASNIINSQKTITGKEFYFLRANLRLNIKAIATKLKVTQSALKKWQDDNKVDSKIVDKFRELYLELFVDYKDNIWQPQTISATELAEISDKPKKSIKSNKDYMLFFIPEKNHKPTAKNYQQNFLAPSAEAHLA